MLCCRVFWTSCSFVARFHTYPHVLGDQGSFAALQFFFATLYCSFVGSLATSQGSCALFWDSSALFCHSARLPYQNPIDSFHTYKN